MVGGGGNKIVATLRADGKVFSKDGTTTIAQLANLMNYKIRTEGEFTEKSLSTLSVPTTVVDLGKQLLQFARDSDLKGVKNALSRGAPFTSDWLGMSALHFAAMNNQYEICQVLLSGGINKDSRTKVDRTPLHLACFYGNEKIVELLLTKNCHVNPRDMLRMTPLHWAIEKGHKTIVRMLLKHNADVTLITKFGRTALATAVYYEQADLLEELEAARQAQANRKFNEEHEKETSDAVNSIMGLATDIIDEPESLRKIDDDEDEYTNQSKYAAAKIADLENIKETGILGDSTINLLKSHGISMMPDDDTSKDMLNTALQNGRQLILSEGGKLLLNQTKKTQNNNNNNNINSLNYNNNNNQNINNSKTIVPVRVRNESVSYLNTNAASRLKPNIITKAKDNTNLAKNKNIRIISLNDFKKLYGNTNLKAMHKLPGGQRVLNIRAHAQPKMQQIKIGIPSNVVSRSSTIMDDNGVIDEDGTISHIIHIETKDNDISDASESEIQPQAQIQIQPQQQKQQTLIKQQLQPSQLQQPNATRPVRIVPAKRVEHMGTVQMRPLPPTTTTPTTTTAAAIPQAIKINLNRPTTMATIKKQEPSLSSTTGGGLSISSLSSTGLSISSTPATIVPILPTSEICRQLLELRKQNDELRRKFDIAQSEKEEMRQRIERLEELLIVERSDFEYTNS